MNLNKNNYSNCGHLSFPAEAANSNFKCLETEKIQIEKGLSTDIVKEIEKTEWRTVKGRFVSIGFRREWKK
jgi:hypothetical protein